MIICFEAIFGFEFKSY